MDMNLPGNASLPIPISGEGNILVVTGQLGVGKTTYCQQAIDDFRKAGLKVSGLLSPGRFDQGQKNGIFAINLEGHETRLAASSIPGEIIGIRLGCWTFDPKIFEWGNQCLKQAVGSDVLVIDELGPLEFEMQTGWTTSFEVLRSKKYKLALIVIRPECIDTFSNLGFTFDVKEIVR